MKVIIIDDIEIVIGQNASENWELLELDEMYIWLHLNSFPSCHVVICHDNPEDYIIQYAAELCKNNTKYKNLKNLKICYTPIKNLKKATDIGSVIFKSKRKVNTILI